MFNGSAVSSKVGYPVFIFGLSTYVRYVCDVNSTFGDYKIDRCEIRLFSKEIGIDCSMIAYS